MTERTEQTAARRAILNQLAPSLGPETAKFLAIHTTPQMFTYVVAAMEQARASAILDCESAPR